MGITLQVCGTRLVTRQEDLNAEALAEGLKGDGKELPKVQAGQLAIVKVSKMPFICRVADTLLCKPG